MSTRSRHFLLAASLFWLVTASSCEKSGAQPAAWDRWSDVGTASELFELRHDRPALAGLDDLYLGQPAQAGRSALESYCKSPVRREDQNESSDAYFLGCPTEELAGVEMIRVGFWPRIGDRVATLEVKREFAPPPAVWSAIREYADESADTDRNAQQIQIVTDDWRFFADWDQGYDAPVHLTVGLDPSVTADSFE